MLKIAIDTFGCDHGRSGQAAYIINFSSNLPEDLKDKIELFGQEEDRYTYTSGKELSYNSFPITDKLKTIRFFHRHGLKYNDPQFLEGRQPQHLLPMYLITDAELKLKNTIFLERIFR